MLLYILYLIPVKKKTNKTPQNKCKLISNRNSFIKFSQQVMGIFIFGFSLGSVIIIATYINGTYLWCTFIVYILRTLYVFVSWYLKIVWKNWAETKHDKNLLKCSSSEYNYCPLHIHTLTFKIYRNLANFLP